MALQGRPDVAVGLDYQASQLATVSKSYMKGLSKTLLIEPFIS
jgi:hypothetical protein